MSDDGHLHWRALWVETTEALGDVNEARWICQQAGGFEGVEWLDALDAPATERAVARVDAMVARRRAGEPLAYVLGSWAFRTVELMVDRRVLIPRPETELVAEVAIEAARQCHPRRTVVDLGTGSGAIALACAAELPIEGTSVWATDRSDDALAVARANLAGLGRVGANVRVVGGSWFEALPADLAGQIDVVVTNPPYIAQSDVELDPSVLAWEPAPALFAGSDGLADLRVVIQQAPRWVRPGGWLVAEIGHRQGEAVAALAQQAGYAHVEIRRDLAGRDRILVARRGEHA